MRSHRRLTSMLLGATLLLVSIAPAAAQDPSAPSVPSPMCALLTADEVSTALGEVLTVTTSDDSGCDYQADFSAGGLLSLSSRRDTGTLADFKAAFGEGEAIEVAGQPGSTSPTRSRP